LRAFKFLESRSLPRNLKLIRPKKWGIAVAKPATVKSAEAEPSIIATIICRETNASGASRRTCRSPLCSRRAISAKDPTRMERWDCDLPQPHSKFANHSYVVRAVRTSLIAGELFGHSHAWPGLCDLASSGFFLPSRTASRSLSRASRGAILSSVHSCLS
jgi:hypothetical protein